MRKSLSKKSVVSGKKCNNYYGLSFLYMKGYWKGYGVIMG